MWIRVWLAALLLLGSTVALADYQQREIDGITYGIFRADPTQVSLHWRDENGQAYGSLRSLKSTLQQNGREVQLLMNAGIYSKDMTPAGLWIEHGRILSHLNRKSGKGNFHIQPNGVFWLRQGQAFINTTAAYAASGVMPDYAVQSGPMLVIDGQINAHFVRGLSSPYSRNAVCVTRDGELLFVLTESYRDEWPSFYRLADALREMGCYQALYLDGSISSWYIPGVSGTFHWSDFVGIIAVTTNQKPQNRNSL